MRDWRASAGHCCAAAAVLVRVRAQAARVGGGTVHSKQLLLPTFLFDGAIVQCAREKSVWSMVAIKNGGWTRSVALARWPRRRRSSAAPKALPSALAAACIVCALALKYFVACTPHARLHMQLKILRDQIECVLMA